MAFPPMTIMARSEPILTPVLADDKLRQSMQDANVTVEHAEETVARVHRQIMRCDVVLRRLRLRVESLNARALRLNGPKNPNA